MYHKGHAELNILSVFLCQKSAPGIFSFAKDGTVWRRLTAFLGLFIFIFLMLTQSCMAQSPQPAIWKVIMAEAVDQGYEGMYAVACVIRNRGGDLSGFYGAKRKDLDAFCEREGTRYINMAKEIENCVFVKKDADATGGATHFEALERYGIPYWAHAMIVTVKIGEHTFYKKCHE